MDFYDCDALIGRAIDQDEESAPAAADLAAEMARSGVARSLVTNYKIAFSTPDWGNADLQRDVAAHPGLRGVYGTWIMEDRGNPPPTEAVDRLIKMNAAGVQLWPRMCGFDFAPWQAPELFNALADRGLPLFMHSDQATFDQVHSVLQAYPKLIVVLQRVMYGDSLRALAVMRACPGLHIATSPRFVGGSVLEQFDRYVGSNRLLFGTGLFKYDALPAMAQITYADLSDAKKSAIASGNLVRLLEGIR